ETRAARLRVPVHASRVTERFRIRLMHFCMASLVARPLLPAWTPARRGGRSVRSLPLAPPDPRERLPLASLEPAPRVHDQDRLLPRKPFGLSALDVTPCRLGQPEAARAMRQPGPVVPRIGAHALDDDQRDSVGDRELPPHLLRGFDAVDRVDD